MKKILEPFKNKFNIFAFIQLLMTIVLFIVLICMIGPEVGGAFDYLFTFVNDPEVTILGYEVLSHSRSIFYLFMFLIQLVYSSYGIYVLFKSNNERRIFKIIHRSITYVCGILAIYNIFGVIYFLVMPVTDIVSIMIVIFMILAIIIAILGRLCANFTIFVTSLRNRKIASILVIASYIGLLFISLFFLDDLYYQESITFYTMEIISSIVSILAVIFYQDKIPYVFLKEPNIKKHDVSLNTFEFDSGVKEIKDHEYEKNVLLEKVKLPNTLEVIHQGAFSNCLNLEEIILPKSLKEIEPLAFFNCVNLRTIKYKGTKEEFNKIILHKGWLYKAKSNVIHTSDGIYLISDNDLN